MGRHVSLFDPLISLDPGVTLIEASAGTGKTYSITNLFVRLVAERGLGVDQILVVTFTVAATAELKDRIRKRLRDAASALQKVAKGEATPADISDEVFRHLASAKDEERSTRFVNIQTALSRMDEASISTIHGFCKRMLERYPIETRVDFDAEMVTREQDLLEEVCDDLYVATLNALEPEIAQVLRGRNLRSLLQRVCEMALYHPDAFLISPPLQEVLQPDPKAWWTLFRNFQEEWYRSKAEAFDCIVNAIDRKILDGRKWRRDYLESRDEKIEACLSKTQIAFSPPPEELKYFDGFYLVSITKKGYQPPCHPLFERVSVFLENVKRMNEDFASFLRAMVPRMFREARDLFAARKRQNRAMSFQDLLVFLRDALVAEPSGEALARAIRNQYRAALIDEFQDTDGVQWEIFRRIFCTPEHFLFLIGDPKQSIYAFRGADIYAYLEARKSANREYTLPVNWRSDGRWVQALNHMYLRTSEPFLDDEIAYVQVDVPQAHRADRLRIPGVSHAPFVIRFLGRDQYRVTGTDSILKTDLWRDIHITVANDVARLLASGAEVLTKDSRWRPLTPRDIAILVNKHSEAFDIQRALRRMGIPAVLYSEASVLKSEAATDLALFLAAVVAPEDRNAVRTALSTVIFGHSIAEIVDIEGRGDEWAHRVEDFERWGQTWRERGFTRMFRSVLHEQDTVARLLAKEGGERLVTDLLHLAEILQATESDLGYGPEALLTWFLRERAHPTEALEARQLRLESDEDAVEVVTIHRAKGLEYPVVFCPYLCDGFLHETKQATVRFHDKQSGRILVAAKDIAKEPEWEEIQNAVIREAFAENLRLAYVALTRAKHMTWVYLAPSKDCGRSPLARLLFPPPENLKAEVWSVFGQLDDKATLERLEHLAKTSLGTIAVEPVDLHAVAPKYRARDAGTASSIKAACFRRQGLDLRWQWTSFTRMVGTLGGEEPGEDEEPKFEGADGVGDALLRDFPRGRVAGRCLHKIFERLDFASEDQTPVVCETLGEYGLDVEALAPQVCEAVRVALNTPLPSPAGPIRLRDVSMKDRLNEVSFLCPLAGGLRAQDRAVSGRDLALVFERYAGRWGKDFADAIRDLPAMRGFLSGQMDLVFRAGGRWFLLDFKSNDLGDSCADYEPDRLVREVLASRYFLQYHLYAVALDRYATIRVPGHDWDQHFGGVFYLFVRGLDGSGRTGIFYDRPPMTLIRALSEVLGEGI